MMPNFHVHWMVALQSAGAAPPSIAQGLATYSRVSQVFLNQFP